MCVVVILCHLNCLRWKGIVLSTVVWCEDVVAFMPKQVFLSVQMALHLLQEIQDCVQHVSDQIQSLRDGLVPPSEYGRRTCDFPYLSFCIRCILEDVVRPALIQAHLLHLFTFNSSGQVTFHSKRPEGWQ